ncbi:MAG: hypothetical protein AAFQ36_03200 [Pseudomonadota bacterium]
MGATIIGNIAFPGIGLSPDSTGEFMFSLFAVIGISPLLGHYFFKQGSECADDAYSGVVFRTYGGFLGFIVRLRWIMAIVLIGVTAGCFVLFG